MLTKIKALRMRTGLKQREFGELLGLDRRYYTRFENGTQSIPEKYWASIADNLGVKIEDIIDTITGYAILEEEVEND